MALQVKLDPKLFRYPIINSWVNFRIILVQLANADKILVGILLEEKLSFGQNTSGISINAEQLKKQPHKFVTLFVILKYGEIVFKFTQL